MKSSPEIEALRALDRTITPSPEADGRIRALIQASIDEQTSLVAEASPAPAREGTVEGETAGPNSRSWRPRQLLLAAAVLALVAGLTVAIGNRAPNDENVVVASSVDLSELSPAERICTGPYATLADDWRMVLESADPGYAVNPTFEMAQKLVQSQRGFVDAISNEIEAGALTELANPDTLTTAVASIEASQAVLDLDGNSDLVTTIGNTHQQLSKLIEENPALASSCDRALVAWPR